MMATYTDSFGELRKCENSSCRGDLCYSVKEFQNGSRSWLLHGEFHRTDGPADERANGIKVWMLNGKRHRLNGPAFISTNTLMWYEQGVLHNLEGPAIMSINPESPDDPAFYIEGVEIVKTKLA